MAKKNPTTVFISYSHDSPEHKKKVRDIADILRSQYGINICADFYEEDNPPGGLFTDLIHLIPKMKKVLLILTPAYKKKADEAKQGVGYEI